MTQNTIVCEKIFSQYKNREVWQVAIMVPSGKKYGRRDISEPLKALRYMFMLQRTEGHQLDASCVESLRAEHRSLKAQSRIPEGQTDMVVEEFSTDCSSQKASAESVTASATSIPTLKADAFKRVSIYNHN